MDNIEFRERQGDLTAAQRTEICNAFRFALRIQRLVERDMSALWDTPRQNRVRAIHDYPMLRRWIGVQRKHKRLRRINRRIRKLRRWIENRRILVVFHNNADFVCRDGRRGAVRGPRYISPVLRFHMCARFFANPAPSRRGDLIIHELCHEMGMMHAIQDDASRILTLAAGRDNKKVTRNPLTYQGIWREYAGDPIP